MTENYGKLVLDAMNSLDRKSENPYSHHFHHLNTIQAAIRNEIMASGIVEVPKNCPGIFSNEIKRLLQEHVIEKRKKELKYRLIDQERMKPKTKKRKFAEEEDQALVVSDQDIDVESLRQTVETLQETIVQLRKDLEDLRHENRNVMHHSSTMEMRKNAVDYENVELKLKLETLQKQFNELEVSHLVFKNASSDIRKKLENDLALAHERLRQFEKDSTGERIAELEKQVGTMKGKLQEALEDRQAFQSKLAELLNFQRMDEIPPM
jgi:chromosome segregation ATPase